MKRWLVFSIGLNLVFCLAGLCLLRAGKPASELMRNRVETNRYSILGAGEAREFLAQPGTGHAVFRWNQIESTDYRTYIANLRAIGCPEQTIRDIITADVHALYNNGSRENWPPLSPQELAVVTALLGPLNGETQQRPASVVLRALGRPVQDTNVVVPLAFRQLRSPLSLSSDQAEAFRWLQEDFETTIGGTNQDPADPEYFRRWQQAQKASDAMMLGLLGYDFVTHYKMKLLEEQGLYP